MQAYYAAVPDYSAFQAPSHHPLEWRQVLAEVLNHAPTKRESVSILEFGSGRSGFPAWLHNQLYSTPGGGRQKGAYHLPGRNIRKRRPP
jgi:hypothetical protein